jgi:hypothetical protein
MVWSSGSYMNPSLIQEADWAFGNTGAETRTPQLSASLRNLPDPYCVSPMALLKSSPCESTPSMTTGAVVGSPTSIGVVPVRVMNLLSADTAMCALYPVTRHSK